MIKVRVRYLLWLRDKTGVDQEEYLLNEGSTVKDLVEMIASRHESLRKHLVSLFEPDSRLIILLNNVKPEPDRKLKDNDTLTIMPPVSGG